MESRETASTCIEIPLKLAATIESTLRTAKSADRAIWVCGYLCSFFEQQIALAKINNEEEPKSENF